MNFHTRVLSFLLWLGSLACCLWTAQLLIFEPAPFNRNEQIQKVQESWEAFAQTFPAESNEAHVASSILQNLKIARSHTILLERTPLVTLSLITLVLFGLASLVLVTGLESPQSSRSHQTESSPASDSEPVSFYQHNLEQTMADLSRVCQELGELDQEGERTTSSRHALIDNQLDHLVRMEAQLQRVCSDAMASLSTAKDISDKLQRLSTQCEDSSHFAAATRLEWNAMGSKLRQLKENHDRIKNISDKIGKQHTVTTESLIKTLDFGATHSKHTETSREQVQRLAEISRQTLGTMDMLAASMAESNQDVTSANKLVRGLSERAEEIINIIDVIDDIAEQTNQLALNASIEAARAGEQGQGFAVVAGEVRSLAARSSTATKSITDLLGTIQQEAEEASHCLEKSAKSVGVAHSRMRDVDRSYREAVTLSRQALSELNQIVGDVNGHMHELKQIEKQAAEVRKFCVGLNNLLEEQGRMTSVTYTESNQLTVHSDRLSRLLNRQFFEMAHCDRLVEGIFFTLETMKGRVEEGIANAQSVLTNFNQTYQQALTQEAGGPRRGARYGRMIELLKSCRRSLEIIRNPSELARAELDAVYKLIGNEHKVQPGAVLGRSAASDEATEADIGLLPDDDVLIGETDQTQKVS